MFALCFIVLIQLHKDHKCYFLFVQKSRQWNMRLFLDNHVRMRWLPGYRNMQARDLLSAWWFWSMDWSNGEGYGCLKATRKQRKFTHQGKTEHRRWMVQPCRISVVAKFLWCWIEESFPLNSHGQKWQLIWTKRWDLEGKSTDLCQ